ncbi:MAG: hypothetical protein ACK51G_05935 [Pseudomonadota bacterium]|jgi:hypothetical protein
MAGGSRCGAGRSGWRAKAEGSLRLDLRQFKQRGLLFPGSDFTWRWRYGSGGESAGNIGVRIGQCQVALQFSINGKNASHAVDLDRTACTFGGSRQWFGCPRCHRRCLVLYLCGVAFLCRLCSGVAYTSQSEDVIGRSWRRQQRLEARLGPDGARPKRMHRATYERLQAAMLGCEERREGELARLLPRYGLVGW